MKEAKKKQHWKPFLKVLDPNIPWAWYIINFIVSLFISSITVRLPQITAQIMAGEIFNTGLIVEFTILTIINIIIGTLYSASVTWAGYRAERNIQRSLWRKMIRMPMRSIDRQAPSSLISRVTSDTMQVTASLTTFFGALTIIATLVMIAASILAMSRTIALAMLLVIPYILAVMIIPGRFYYRFSDQQQNAVSAFTTFVAERLSNMSLVKASAANESDCRAGFQAAKASYDASIRTAVVDAVIQPFAYCAEAISGAVVLIAGGKLVNQGELELSGIITMFMYSQNIYSCLIVIVSTFQLLKRAQGATRVVGEIVSGRDEAVRREQTMQEVPGDIVFRKVSFRYENGPEVLSGVNLTIPAGKITAVVGPSGAGKSTLLSLMERLYDPDDGQVIKGSVPAGEIHLDDWRTAFGYIQQSSPLLSGTIRENIAYGLGREATEEEMVSAAKQANAYGFIMKLPDGFDTDIGQLGDKLSGGERQRIAIARMIVKDPAYLLLDEATSNLDADNEAQVQAAFQNMLKGRTAVIVAHNLRTIQNADQVVVMDHGRVQAVGDHDSLYQNNELYRNYYDLQF